jgi:hypothetical protein
MMKVKVAVTIRSARLVPIQPALNLALLPRLPLFGLPYQIHGVDKAVSTLQLLKFTQALAEICHPEGQYGLH